MIEYAGDTLIGFDDRSYRWVAVKRFKCEPTSSDNQLLADVIGHSRYRDNYLSPDSHEHDTQTIHGPYRVAEIAPSSFERIEPSDAVAVVEEFCLLYDCPPSPEIFKRIQAVVVNSLEGSVCYRLKDLPHAIHEYGFVLMEFRELLLIDRNAGSVFSVVMAID